MKKTYMYNFMPSKEEEEAAKARGVPYQVTRTLVEIRDIYAPRPFDPNNPWVIRRVVSGNEVAAGKLLLSHNEMFEHVLRHWCLDLANYVLFGNKHHVTIVDYTNSDSPKKYRSEYLYVERGPNDCYIVGWVDMVHKHSCKCGDEIGLFWDASANAIGFKLLRRHAV